MVGVLVVAGVVAVLLVLACATRLCDLLARLRDLADNAWSRADVRLRRRCI